jgi:DNA repair protein RecN (Recombination protein N)
MLQHLKIRDLILVEEGETEFGKGLNIFTGETGSGKSAILTAIRLIAGARASSDWIRAGAESLSVEAKLEAHALSSEYARMVGH